VFQISSAEVREVVNSGVPSTMEVFSVLVQLKAVKPFAHTAVIDRPWLFLTDHSPIAVAIATIRHY